MFLKSTFFKLTISLSIIAAAAPLSQAQDNSNWTSSDEHRDPSGNLNPTRTRESHTESNGRTIDRKTVERLGPDGRYVPYLDTETETVRVDANTTRTTERSFGRGPDGQRTLMVDGQVRSLSPRRRRIRSGRRPGSHTHHEFSTDGGIEWHEPVQRPQRRDGAA